MSANRTLIPLYDRILIKRFAAEAKTKSGLIIPETAKEKPIEAEVVAVGNGKILEDGSAAPLQVKIGDHVLFGKYGGTEIKFNDEDLLILREEEILAIVRGG